MHAEQVHLTMHKGRRVESGKIRAGSYRNEKEEQMQSRILTLLLTVFLMCAAGSVWAKTMQDRSLSLSAQQLNDDPPQIIDGPFVGGKWYTLPSTSGNDPVFIDNMTLVWSYSDDYASCSGACTHAAQCMKVGDSTPIPLSPVYTDVFDGKDIAYVVVPVTEMPEGTYEFTFSVTDCAAQETQSGTFYFTVEDNDKSTYYITNQGNNTNDGLSPVSDGYGHGPWSTLAKVQEEADNGTFEPGNRILLKKGDTWDEQIVFTGSGSEGNPVTISSYGSGTTAPVIDAGTANYALWLKGSNVTVSKIRFQGGQFDHSKLVQEKGGLITVLPNGRRSASVTQFAGYDATYVNDDDITEGNNITIDNCTFIDSNIRGIQLDYVSGALVDNCIFENILADNSTPGQTMYSVYVHHAQNTLVRNSLFYSSTSGVGGAPVGTAEFGFGFHPATVNGAEYRSFYHAENTTIENNVISYTDANGIFIGGIDTLVQNNYIHHTGRIEGMGLMVVNGIRPVIRWNVVHHNNMCETAPGTYQACDYPYAPGEHPNDSQGIYMSEGNYYGLLYGNITYSNAGPGLSAIGEGCKIYNNVVYNNNLGWTFMPYFPGGYEGGGMGDGGTLAIWETPYALRPGDPEVQFCGGSRCDIGTCVGGARDGEACIDTGGQAGFFDMYFFGDYTCGDSGTCDTTGAERQSPEVIGYVTHGYKANNISIDDTWNEAGTCPSQGYADWVNNIFWCTDSPNCDNSSSTDRFRVMDYANNTTINADFQTWVDWPANNNVEVLDRSGFMEAMGYSPGPVPLITDTELRVPVMTGNQWADPALADPANYDFTLLPGSPALHAGIDVDDDHHYILNPYSITASETLAAITLLETAFNNDYPGMWDEKAFPAVRYGIAMTGIVAEEVPGLPSPSYLGQNDDTGGWDIGAFDGVGDLPPGLTDPIYFVTSGQTMCRGTGVPPTSGYCQMSTDPANPLQVTDDNRTAYLHQEIVWSNSNDSNRCPDNSTMVIGWQYKTYTDQEWTTRYAYPQEMRTGGSDTYWPYSWLDLCDLSGTGPFEIRFFSEDCIGQRTETDIFYITVVQ